MLKRKDKILISAIELLDLEGVNGVTTKNLAKKQQVTEPALYRQYKGKQDILNHIVEEYSSYDMRIINTIKETNLTGIEAIDFYVKRFAELYQNYQELTTVMFSMDLFMYNETTKRQMQDTTKNRLSFLEEVVNNAKEQFVNHCQLEAVEVASLINGVIFSEVFEWRMADRQYDLYDKLTKYITKLLIG